LNRLARLGAVARLAEIRRERQALAQLLGRAAGHKREERRSSTILEHASASERPRRKGVWTAEQRKAVSERMKKYWAKRHASTKK